MAAAVLRQICLLRLSLRNCEKQCTRTVASGRNKIEVINYLQNETVEKHRTTRLSQHPERGDAEKTKEEQEVTMPRDFRYVQPEFLPTTNTEHRDRIREQLEREDMYRRRAVMEIPEFYVGSIMAVTVADQFANGKSKCFLGICTQRGGCGLRAYFILRNVIDDQGVEIMYEMYSPMLQKIEVLKLEKRLDEDLMYLRDAPLKYSTFPVNMDPVALPKGSTVPVNTIKVPLNPPPWHERWERRELRGAEVPQVNQKRQDKAKAQATPWEKYDIMKQYRSTTNDTEAEHVMREVFVRKQKIDKERSKLKPGISRGSK